MWPAPSNKVNLAGNPTSAERLTVTTDRFLTGLAYATRGGIVLGDQLLPFGLCWFVNTGYPESEFMRYLNRTIGAVGALALVSALCIVIECAGVMSVGARSRWAHLGIGAPIIGLVLLEVVSQALSLVLMLVVPVGLRLDGPEGGGMRLVVGDMATPLLDAIRGGTDPTTVGLGSALLGPLLATVLAIWAVNSIEHHTSLR